MTNPSSHGSVESYLSELVTEYMPWRAGRYARLGLEFCLGSKVDTNHFVDDGAIQLPWGATMDPSQFANVRLLRLIPSQRQLKKAIVPEFVKELPNLEFLALPLPLAVRLTPQFVKPTLRGIDIVSMQGSMEALGGMEPKWPAGIVCSGIKALRLLDDVGATQIDTLLGISHQQFPSLQYLMVNVDKRGRRLQELSRLGGLKILHLECVANHPVFEYINAPLKALSIASVGPKFNLGELATLADVELLWLNGLQCEVDCRIFTKLPNLKELNLLNSRKLRNIEMLLKCPKLESLDVLNCGRPFTKESKQFFAAHGYKRLQIDFA